MFDVSRTCDDAHMWRCICAAGIEKVIRRFPKGLDARLGPYPADPSPAGFLKEVVKDHQTGPIDPWEADFYKVVKQEIQDDEEWEDEVVGGAGASGGSLKGKDCAFSPGEWQKLSFAGSLIKQSADLRSVLHLVRAGQSPLMYHCSGSSMNPLHPSIPSPVGKCLTRLTA